MASSKEETLFLKLNGRNLVSLVNKSDIRKNSGNTADHSDKK